MPTELATAYVRIVPTTEGVTDNIEKALTGAADSGGQKSGKAIAGGIAKGLAVGAAAVGTAAVAMTTGIVNGAKDVAQYGDNVDKMSQKIGISAQAYQQWDYVMQRAGTSIDLMKQGMKTLSTQAANNSEAFQKLGISEEEVATLSQEDLFGRVIEGLSGMEEGSERTALASQLLGRAGADLGPLLNEGTEAIEEQKQMALDYGMVMSDDMVAASARFVDAQTTLSMTIGGLKNRLLGEFLPAMSDVTEGLATLFSGDISGLDQINAGIDTFMSKITDMLPKVLEVGGSIVMTLANSIIANAPKLFESATGLIMQFVQSAIASLPQVLQVAVQLVLALVSGISSALPQLIPAAVSAIGQICQTLISNLPMILQAVLVLVHGALEGIISAIPILLEFLPVLIDQLLSQLPGMIEMLNAELGSLIPLLIEGCMALVEGIVSATPVILQSLIAYLPSILDQIISGLLSNLVILIQGCITLVEGIVAAAPQIVSALIEYLPELVIQVAMTLIQNLPTLISACGQIIVSIARALPGLFGSVISSTVQLVGQLAQKIASLAGQFLQAAGQWVQQIWQGIVSGWGTITGGIGGLAQKVLSAIGAVFAGAASIGSNLARGLWNGLSSGWSWLTSQVTSLANKLKNAVKSALGIHSPSTEMRWVGEMFNAGLAEGLGETGEVEGALNNVTGLLTDTINPNLALSGSVSGGGNDMVSAIQALREDVRNLKIYLDTGALVGGIIGQTDASLGRRDALAARGGAVV